MAKKNDIILNITPLTRVSPDKTQVFSYLSDKKLPAGTLVTIPFSGRKINGIVLSVSSNKKAKNINLKKIEKVIEEKLLTPKQIKFAQWLSDYYISPLGIILKQFVPKLVSARKKKEIEIKKRDRDIMLTKDQIKAMAEIEKSKKNKFLLFGPASSGKTEIYIESAKNALKKSKTAQVLILLPELSLTPQAIERYGQALGSEKLVELHSKLAKGKFYQNWQKIKSGEANIIIATRLGIFALFKNLKLIVIDEEQDISHKQWDMNPRYDARTVSEELSKIFSAKLIMGSATPSIENFYRASVKKELKLLKLPRLKIKGIPPLSSVKMIDMRKERWDKNFSPISRQLKTEIAFHLKYGRQVLLFINRRGMSKFTVCSKCKEILRCPKCDRALVYDNRGIYTCIHCHYKMSALTACPKCGNLELKNVGLGTQKIEGEIKKMFPSARIRRVDFDTSKKVRFWEDIYSDFTKKKIDILIGTQMITKGWDFPNLGLVAILDTDSLFSVPDFNTNEHGFSRIIQAAGRTSRPGSKYSGTAIIQTFNPFNKNIPLAAEFNYEKFFELDIKEREDLANPPFSKIIKLFIQDANLQNLDKKAQTVYNVLTKKAGRDLKIIGPFYPINPKIRGFWRKNILIKFPPEKTLNSSLKNELKKLGQQWRIDVDPIGIV